MLIYERKFHYSILIRGEENHVLIFLHFCFRSPIKFPSQRNFFIEIGPETTKLCLYQKNAKKYFYISAFCSQTRRPTEKIFLQYRCSYVKRIYTK